MKKSYIKICLFELIVLAILTINSFESNILNLYKLPLFIIILDAIMYVMLGYEKRKKRSRNEVIFQIFIFSVATILIYYIAGFFIGFAKNKSYLNSYGFTMFIVPIILTILFKEHFRNTVLTKCGKQKILIVLTTIMFIMIDLTQSLSILKWNNAHEIFKYVAIYVLPSITTNILLTYTTRKTGYIPSIIYLTIFNLYRYVMPIVPNPTEYLKAIVDLIMPLLFIKIVSKASKKYEIEEIEIERKNKKQSIISLTSCIIIATILVYFVSGYFRYYAISIASNSMIPTFKRGDVVIVEQISRKNKNLNKIKKGEILAFKEKNTIVVHRIIRKVKIKDEIFVYTKGDANNFNDNWKISEQNIIGIVKHKISYIGYPTVLFSEM